MFDESLHHGILRRIALGGMIGLATLLAALPAAAQMRAPDLKAQMARLGEWWPGRYDNHEQIVRQSGGGLSAEIETPFFRMHTLVERVAGSPLGEDVYRRTVYRGRGESAPWRIELEVVAPDLAAQALRVRRFAVDASGTPRPLGPACDLMLRYVGDQFRGGIEGRA